MASCYQGGPQGVGKVLNQSTDLRGRGGRGECSRVPALSAWLAEGPHGRADLATRVAVASQVGSHTGGSGTDPGPLLAITAGQAAHSGLCRPPAVSPPLDDNDAALAVDRGESEPSGRSNTSERCLLALDHRCSRDHRGYGP